MGWRRAGVAGGALEPRATRASGVKIEAHLHRRRVRHPDPLGEESGGLETWLIENGYRIPPGLAGARQLHQAGDEVLRRQGEPRRAVEARLHLPAAAPDGLRVAEVHAPDPARHGQRRRSPRSCSSSRSPGRGGSRPPTTAPCACRRTPRSAVRQGRLRPLLQGDVQPAGQKQDMRTLFLEYAWDMAWCDPCAADRSPPTSCGSSASSGPPTADGPCAGAQSVFLTRLHLRYDAAHFPEDLGLPGDRRPREFPGALHPAPPLDGRGDLRGGETLPPGAPERVRDRRRRPSPPSPAGSAGKIRKRMNLAASTRGASKDDPWWKQIWTD